MVGTRDRSACLLQHRAPGPRNHFAFRAGCVQLATMSGQRDAAAQIPVMPVTSHYKLNRPFSANISQKAPLPGRTPDIQPQIFSRSGIGTTNSAPQSFTYASCCVISFFRFQGNIRMKSGLVSRIRSGLYMGICVPGVYIPSL